LFFLNRKFRKIAVLMGGPSAEREVSLRSGAAVAKGLREAGYDVVEVDVKSRELDLPAGIDAAFVALHGEFGEDGEVQKLLEKKGVPYTGSGPYASKAAFDKVLSKKIFVDNGIPTPSYEILRAGIKRKLPLPVVVKPARQGSSIGVHRVFSESEWPAALKDAFSHDSNVLVEAYIEGRELTVGIVGAEVLPVIEIVAPDDWYGFDAKYTKGKTRYLVPAPLDEQMSRTCQNLALQTFTALGCRNMGRVDIRLSEDEKPYVLELNSIPGFTETSLLPKAAAESGLNFSALCDRIVQTINT
jgi:D-alanine-D-alanine ligase